MYIYICIFIHIYTYIFTYVYVFTHIYTLYIFIHMFHSFSYCLMCFLHSLTCFFCMLFYIHIPYTHTYITLYCITLHYITLHHYHITLHRQRKNTSLTWRYSTIGSYFFSATPSTPWRALQLYHLPCHPW